MLASLARRGARVTYHDPLVDQIVLGGSPQSSIPLTPERLRDQDLVLVLVPQQGVDWEVIAREAPLIFDCCNVLGKRNDKITRL